MKSTQKMRWLKAIALVFVLLLPGCTKEEEPQRPEAPEGTAWKSSSVNNREIGGSNLTVLSAFYDGASIKDNGFQTIVSQKGTQVLFVLDESKAVRALTYTMSIGDSYEIQQVNATSTVNSLFLLTPGLASTCTSGATELFARLTSLKTYNELDNHFKANLKNSTLSDVYEDAIADSLFVKTIAEYTERYMSDSLKSSQATVWSRFSIIRNQEDKLELTNSGMRFVDVYRNYRIGTNITDAKTLFAGMNGKIPASYGGLITGSAYTNTTRIDETYSPQTQTTITDYWVIGVGKASTTLIPPNYVDINNRETTCKTSLQYFVFPLIDALFGGLGIVDMDKGFKLIWPLIKSPSIIDNIQSATTQLDFIRAMTNFTVEILKAILKTPVVYEFLGLSATSAALIGTFIATGGVLMGGFNVIFYWTQIKQIPPYAKFEVGTKPDAPILALPPNKAVNQPLTVALSWNRNIYAFSYSIQVSNNSQFTDIIFQKNLSSEYLSAQIDGLGLNKTYYWHVRCVNNSGYSNWSETRSFTTIAGKPTADFSGTPRTITTGQSVQFTDQSTNSPTSWSWNFGDGGTSSLQSPSHTYSIAGTYTVILTASNSAGTDSESKGNYIIVNPVATGIVFNPNLTYGSLADIDGNIYKTIRIGSQTWMAENLKTTKYNDGTYIPTEYDNTIWSNTTTPLYCWLKNDPTTYKNTYGALYNWYVANFNNNGGRNVCPTGWHVPSKNEWNVLADFLGGYLNAGLKLKETGNTHWCSFNEANNESGFTALPAGTRDGIGVFSGPGAETAYWLFDDAIIDYAGGVAMSCSDGVAGPNNFYKRLGFL